jgi:hypothetical protein
MLTERAIDHYGNCPKCGSSWDAGGIFECFRAMPHYADKADYELWYLIQESYSLPYKFSRLVGVEHPGRYDGVWEWQCPDCKATFPRFEREVTHGKAGQVR